jgi:branched-chain amino acid transport system ATP-binding protein
VVGLLAGAITATIIGIVALRVRGLYLAVATLIFAYVCDQYLFRQPWLVGSQSGTSIPFEHIGRPGTFPYIDLGSARFFYYAALSVAVVVLYSVANIRNSRTGRAFAAIRGSEVAAASLGINVARFKLIGFACAGALAGLGGGLTLVAQRTVAPDQFNFTHSLYFLAIAVVGGLRSLGGAISSALLFAVLVGEVFFHFPKLSNYLDLISVGLLITVLLFFRGGLGAIPERLVPLRARLRRRFAGRRVGQLEVEAGSETSAPRIRPSRRPFPAFRPAAGVVRASRSGELAVSMARRPLTAAREAFSSLAWASRKGKPPAPDESRSPNGHPSHMPVDVIGLVKRLAPPESEPEPEPGPAQASAKKAPGKPHLADEKEIRDLIKAAAGAHAVSGEEGEGGRRIPVLLSADGITVRFGGLTAVSDASLKVGAGEIIGLIGPNGAGKTTLFNSILGLNQPADGTVRLFGKDVTSWDVHSRAALGVGRTFQVLQLFPELTVFDNLLVATHLQNPTGLWQSILVSKSARQAEYAARERIHAVLRLMEMEHLADRQVAGLPFGVLRLIEVARTLVAGAGLVCFDEPASGLDSAETERLIEWFRLLRQIGITLLVIEHDVSMVVRLCDYIYVLDQGKLISEGTPAHIQTDPAVIASYLGAAPMEVA